LYVKAGVKNIKGNTIKIFGTKNANKIFQQYYPEYR